MSATGANSYIAIVKAATGNPSAIPATPAMTKVNFESADLGAEIKTNISKNMKGNRRTTGVTITGFTVGGGYKFGTTYENSPADEMMAAFLWGEWVVDTPTTGTSQLKDGSLYTPFFIERGHPDISEYFQFMGMSADVWEMSFKDQDIVEGSYAFVGLKTETIKTPTVGATYSDATDNPEFSTVTNVQNVKIDNVPVAECHVKEWTVTVKNNVTGKTGVGILGACSANAHKIDITGKLTAYFEDTDLYKKLLAGTTFSFSWELLDSLGNKYMFLIPRAVLDSDEIPIDGPDDIFDNASFVALDDTAKGCAMLVERTDHT
jgi:hypothetical protein